VPAMPPVAGDFNYFNGGKLDRIIHKKSILFSIIRLPDHSLWYIIIDRRFQKAGRFEAMSNSRAKELKF
jgi:hypothetical protein